MNHPLAAAAALLCLPGLFSPCLAADAVPDSCREYRNSPRYETCQNARKYGLSLNAAALAEQLAERDFAAEFCGAEPDPATQRHTQSLLSGSANMRALHDAHLALLRERCIYDPDGWCQSMGFQRRGRR